MNKAPYLEKYHYHFLLFIFLVLYLIGFLFIRYNTTTRVDRHLVNVLETTNIEYKLIYNIYKKNSKIILREFARKPNILKILSDINTTNKETQRTKLFNAMKHNYTVAKRLGIKQLHFHLLNNESFLRMHTPQKFGDDLSKFRYSVKYVNKTGKAISGFEQGKIVHGFRFVYPLKSKEKKQLGSVEISIDSHTFETVFENTLYIEAYFLLDKKTSMHTLFKEEIGNHYQDSLDSKEYLQTKIDEHDAELKNYIRNNLDSYQNSLKSDFLTKKAFAKEINTGDNYYTKVFIPIHNIKDRKVIAYFVSSSQSHYLNTTHRDEKNLLSSLFIFVLVLVYGLHRNLNYASSLRKKIKEKTEELEASEKEIIEAKKMASLGTLVAGIAHEINTPVGLSITALSHFMEKTKILKEHYDKEEMDQNEFEKYLNKSDSTLNLIFTNLVKAANLIKDFKQLSPENSIEEKKIVPIKKHFEDIISTLQPHLNKKNITIHLDIDKKLELHTYANALTTIMTNLIINSVIHAFNTLDAGIITIKVTKNSKKSVIIYEDNGSGMGEEAVKNVFEPFYTTDRGSGGSGLGMHITFNLVTQKLGGTIHLQSQLGGGIKYTITLNN